LIFIILLFIREWLFRFLHPAGSLIKHISVFAENMRYAKINWRAEFSTLDLV